MENRVFKFVGNSKLLILLFLAVLSFFLTARLVTADLMVGSRELPGQADDIYHYLFHIEWLKEEGLSGAPSVANYNATRLSQELVNENVRRELTVRQPYFLWAYISSKLSLWFSWGPLETFRNNFWIGAAFATIAAGALGVALGGLAGALGILYLSTFRGADTYHGFYWVVPSFYVLCTYFIVLASFLKPNWKVLRTTSLIAFGLLFWLHPSASLLWIICLSGLLLAQLLDGSIGWKSLLHYCLAAATSVLLYSILLKFHFIPQIHLSYGSGIGGLVRKLFDTPPGELLFRIWSFIRELHGWHTNKRYIIGLALFLPNLFNPRTRILCFQVLMSFGVTFGLMILGYPFADRPLLYGVPLVCFLIGSGAGISVSWALKFFENSKIGKWIGCTLILSIFLILAQRIVRESYLLTVEVSTRANPYDSPMDIIPYLQELPSGTTVVVAMFESHYFYVHGRKDLTYAIENLAPMNEADYDNSFLLLTPEDIRKMDNDFEKKSCVKVGKGYRKKVGITPVRILLSPRMEESACNSKI